MTNFLKLTPVLLAEDVEACVGFWNALGMETTMTVPFEESVGSAALSADDTELMYQSFAMSRAQDPKAMEGVERAVIYIEVGSLRRVLENLDGPEVVVLARRTEYGTREVYIRDPAGNDWVSRKPSQLKTALEGARRWKDQLLLDGRRVAVCRPHSRRVADLQLRRFGCLARAAGHFRSIAQERIMRTLSRIAPIVTALMVVLPACEHQIRPPKPAVVAEAAPVPDVRFEQLADGVWMHTSYKDIQPWGPFPTNGLIVATGQSNAVLVDTAWNDEQTAQVLAWSESVLHRTVEAAVLTHAHDDKMGGVGVLRAMGVRTYAHPVSNLLAPARGLVAAEFDLEVDVSGNVAEADPAFSGLSIFYPGPGHTVDNMVVGIEAAGVLFGGCLVRPARSFSLGNTADAVVTNWAAATERVAQRFPESSVIVPSHGPPAGPDLLKHTMIVAEDAASKSD